MDQTNMCTCSEQLAIASVPRQEWCEPYDLSTALQEGTIFPCLNLPFFKAPAGNYCVPPTGNSLNPDQKTREALMHEIMCVSFAVNDLTLYLDTHPDCQNGLSMFYSLLKERLDLLAEYAHTQNPLTQTSMITGDCCKNNYAWSEGPLPWEGACI